MAKPKQNKTVEFFEYEVNGKNVKLPILDEASVTPGIRRKTRHMSEERAGEEFFWLMIETYLTEDEIEVIDNLTSEELTEVMDNFQKDAGNPKE